MSITHSIFAALMALFFCWTIGMGLITFFISKKSIGYGIYCQAPALGFALITLCVAYLSSLGMQTELYAIPFGIFLLSVSISLISRKNILEGSFISTVNSRNLLFYLLVVVALGFLPMVFGGWRFILFRGNAADTLNYLAMANALMYYPMNWIASTHSQELLQISPSLELVIGLFSGRWITSATLAYFSSLFKIAPIEFEYAYTVLLMIVSSLAFIGIFLERKLNFIVAALLAIGYFFGFFGQFILDMRAFSQISSLPILVVILGQVFQYRSENKIGNEIQLGWKLKGLLLASLTLQYPEIVITYIFPLAFIYFIRLKSFKWYKNDYLGAIFGFLLLLPLYKNILRIGKDQITQTLDKSFGWEAAFFRWLDNYPAGIWGLTVSPVIGWEIQFKIFGIFLAVLLYTLLILKIFKYKEGIKSDVGSQVAITFCLILASLAAIYLNGNPFAAGKVLTFNSVLIPLFFGILMSSEKLIFPNNFYHKFLIPTIFLWIIVGLLFSIARIYYADKGVNYEKYLLNHGDNKSKNNPDFTKPLISMCPPGSIVAISEPIISSREVEVHLLEGRGFKVKNYEPLTRIASNPHLNDYIEGASCIYIPGTNTIAPIPDRWNGLAAVTSEFAFDRDKESLLKAWVSSKGIDFYFIANSKQNVKIDLEICPGRDRSTLNPLFIIIDGEENPKAITRCTIVTTNKIFVKGGNKFEVRLRDTDSQVILHKGDPRDLRAIIKLLRVESN